MNKEKLNFYLNEGNLEMARKYVPLAMNVSSDTVKSLIDLLK